MQKKKSLSRFKIQRALGIELPGLGKTGALERRPYGPGQHGNARKKMSDYSIRLKEKQKMRYHYGLREKQLVNYVKKSKRIKNKSWMDVLIVTLERSLCNVVFRMKFAPSMMASAQLISHGHILVNGKKIDKKSYTVKVNDKITLVEKALKNSSYLQAQSNHPLLDIPANYEMSENTGKVLALPLPTDIPFPFEGQLVIEYYSKVKS